MRTDLSPPAPVCPECGGNCAPECGLHPAGCIYGGFSVGYWTRTEGCTLNHGEEEFVCEGCGAVSPTPNYTTDGVLLCGPCYDAVPRTPVANIDPHIQGVAQCVACHKEWRAVAPVSADAEGLECPACHQLTGRIL